MIWNSRAQHKKSVNSKGSWPIFLSQFFHWQKSVKELAFQADLSLRSRDEVLRPGIQLLFRDLQSSLLRQMSDIDIAAVFAQLLKVRSEVAAICFIENRCKRCVGRYRWYFQILQQCCDDGLWGSRTDPSKNSRLAHRFMFYPKSLSQKWCNVDIFYSDLSVSEHRIISRPIDPDSP